MDEDAPVLTHCPKKFPRVLFLLVNSVAWGNLPPQLVSLQQELVVYLVSATYTDTSRHFDLAGNGQILEAFSSLSYCYYTTPSASG